MESLDALARRVRTADIVDAPSAHMVVAAAERLPDRRLR